MAFLKAFLMGAINGILMGLYAVVYHAMLSWIKSPDKYS